MYDPKQKTTVGCFDKQKISPEYVKRVNGNRKRLLEKQTEAEKVFEANFARIVADELCTHLKAQREFYIADGVAFIVDFYFKKFKLAVEIDGREHFFPHNRERDAWRDSLLLKFQGIKTVRFTNKEALKGERNAVFRKLVMALADSPNATPSSRKQLLRVYEHYF